MTFVFIWCSCFFHIWFVDVDEEKHTVVVNPTRFVMWMLFNIPVTTGLTLVTKDIVFLGRDVMSADFTNPNPN